MAGVESVAGSARNTGQSLTWLHISRQLSWRSLRWKCVRAADRIHAAAAKFRIRDAQTTHGGISDELDEFAFDLFLPHRSNIDALRSGTRFPQSSRNYITFVTVSDLQASCKYICSARHSQRLPLRR